MPSDQRRLFEDWDALTDAGMKQQLAYLWRCPPELIDNMLMVEAWDEVTGGNLIQGIRKKLANLSNLSEEALARHLRQSKFSQICLQRVQVDMKKEGNMRVTLAGRIEAEMKRRGLRRS